MIKKYLFLVLLFSQSLFSYYDEELHDLWSSIEDITHPTIAEYKLIENYLKNGHRPYLEPLSNHDRFPRLRGLQLIGSHDELPILEQHSFNIDKTSDKRCIIIYASYNGIYPQKARNLLNELKQCGYKGHVLLRIGGFPDLENGGLKICFVPYAFKVAFLLEAQRLGFEEVLWIDTAMHPLSNLENIFAIIKYKGYYFTSVGKLSDNAHTHLADAAATLHINPQQYHEIPHISSSLIGLNMKNQKAVQLLENWYTEAENLYPFITCWPEELSLSAIAWRLNCQPATWFGNCVCGEHEVLMPIVRQRPLHFYIDPIR